MVGGSERPYVGARHEEEDHPTVAKDLNNLAALYRAQGRYAEAERLQRRDLAISEKALGPEHPRVATSLNNLAALYEAQGRTAEAEPLYRRTLAIVEQAFGPEEHALVGVDLEAEHRLVGHRPGVWILPVDGSVEPGQGTDHLAGVGVEPSEQQPPEQGVGPVAGLGERAAVVAVPPTCRSSTCWAWR